MRITFAAGTHVGLERSHNEDNHLLAPEHGLFLVCDGMGGHAAGEVASKVAVDTIHTIIDEYADGLDGPESSRSRSRALVSLLRSAVEDANRAVHALSRNEKTWGAGTTCTGLLVRHGKVAMAHVGDSRAYLLRDGALQQLSVDHTFGAEAIAKGILSEEEVAKIPEAAFLTRAVGPNPSVVVDTLLFDLLPEDTLLLCSDGLWEYLKSDEQWVDLLRGNLDDVPDKLIALANGRGGHDNITAVVLRALADTDDQEAMGRITRVVTDLAALRHIDMFNDLNHAELSCVTQVMTAMSYDAEDVILRQGESTESLFVLAEGHAQVERDNEVIATLQPGSHFGEMALLTRRPRAATVRATESCRVLILERESFFSLAKHDTTLGLKFLWKLAQTLATRLEETYDMPLQRQEKEPVSEQFPSPFSKK